MISVGDSVGTASVARRPGDWVTIDELVADGPILLFFYLFDWSST